MRPITLLVATMGSAALAATAHADVLVVDTVGPEKLSRPVAIEVGSVNGRVPIWVSEAGARTTPAADFQGLAEFIERHGFEMAAPLQGSMTGGAGRLDSSDLTLVLLRHGAAGDELIDATVTGAQTESGKLMLEVRGFPRSGDRSVPEFVAVFEGWIEP